MAVDPNILVCPDYSSLDFAAAKLDFTTATFSDAWSCLPKLGSEPMIPRRSHGSGTWTRPLGRRQRI